MKQINFKKIIIQNFLSIGEQPVEINFKTGLNIITGTNFDKEDSRNGVGKSSVIESIFYVLFGNTLRELKKEQIINNVNKKKCSVTVEFDVIESGNKDEYILTRGIFPTKIKLIKNNTDITSSSIPKTTEQIKKIICSSPEVFINTIAMTVNNNTPFMAQKKVEKRKFIEGILRLGIFSEMLLMARQEYKDAKREYALELAKHQEIESSYKNYLKYQKDQETSKNDRIKVLLDRERNNNIEYKELLPKIKKIKKNEMVVIEKNIQLLKKKEKSCIKEIREIVQKIAQAEERQNNNDEAIKELIELEKEDKCYTCFRPLNNKKDVSFIEKKKRSIETRNKNIQSEIANTTILLLEQETIQDKCLRGIEKFNKQLQSIRDINNENKNIQERIQQLEKWNRQIKVDIKQLKTETNNFTELIEESEKRLKILKENMDMFQTKLETLDAVKFIVSEEGVKSFIVKKILKVLNGKLAVYLKEMDANCTCRFNEYFEEEIINDKGQECSYHNFSSGEKKRIDLAMLFTFMDIRRLQGDVRINISFYDEILDTSLDDRGIHLFLDILQNRIDKYNECTYIVSHKDSAIQKASGEVIYLEKRNGFTHLAKG